MIIHDLQKRKLVSPPKFLADNTQYLTYTGSIVYGCSTDSSDNDVYGFCVPPKEVVFPHLRGHVHGFGPEPTPFKVWTQSHIDDPSTGKQWDFTVFGIVNYFHLLAGCNPNMLDTLYTPRNMVIHATDMANLVRDNRKSFLSKTVYQKFRGYAMSQMSKIRGKVASENPARKASIEAHGYDVKYAVHLVRLLLEVEQLLETGEMVLDRDAHLYRKIRAGEWTIAQLEAWMADKEKQLESLMTNTALPAECDMDELRRLLLTCLEIHYGSLDNAVRMETPVDAILNDLEALLGKYRK